MPDLSFEIVAANPARDMITPALTFDLRVTNRFPEQSIHAVLLRCQIQIEAARRRYSSAEQNQLRDLFDDPSRWGDTLRAMTWVNTSVNVPAFSGSTVYPVTVPCTFDLNVATAKYFHGIAEGDVPLTFLFSGTVFHDSGQGALQVAPISWNKECRFRLPVQIWKSLMDLHYPDAICLNLRRDVFDELYRFKMSEGLPTFEDAIQRMLAIAEQERPVS
ncbi:MAG TPA: DUF6084 family protein [Bryobacteraceae bacterium]|jgi:hypothetical protein|nr:DUF6084 family protein [Bryobacteraceae bacterium]